MKNTRTMAACLPAMIVICGLGGCGGGTPAAAPSPAAATATSDLPAGGAFVGRPWISTTKGHPLGSMLIFLPDRTLLMDSCFETYRISEWGTAGDNIRWREDNIPIEASVSLPSPDELTLHIVGQEHAQTFIAASVPYVCPDLPR